MTDRIIHSEPMLLRFDSYKGRIAKGRLQTVHYCKPFLFEGLDHLIMIMDDVLDAVQFPKQAGEYRHPGKGCEEKKCAFQKIGQPDRQILGGGSQKSGVSFRGQMTLTVNRREHSSIQGMVNVDGVKTHFRSALELMHMLHFYLEHDFQNDGGNGLDQNAK